MDDLVNPLVRQTQITGDFFQRCTSRVARTDLTIAFWEGDVFVGDGSFGQGDAQVELLKQPVDSGIERGYGCGSNTRWGHTLWATNKMTLIPASFIFLHDLPHLWAQPLPG
jgi:hypothetical protein